MIHLLGTTTLFMRIVDFGQVYYLDMKKIEPEYIVFRQYT